MWNSTRSLRLRNVRAPIPRQGWTSFIESRHVLSVATPDDIPKLISVRGRLLGRHSDEALEEVQTVDRIVKVLRRRAAGATKPNE
jgi:hypothetical protein